MLNGMVLLEINYTMTCVTILSSISDIEAEVIFHFLAPLEVDALLSFLLDS